MKMSGKELIFLCIAITSHIFGAAREFNPLQTVYQTASGAFDERAILAIEKAIGYTFNKKSRLQKAFTTDKKDPIKNYEIYEYRGDAVLKQVQMQLVHKEFPKATPGERTAVKSAIESLAPLCALAVRLGLPKYIQHSTNSVKASVVEDVVEALIWAIYKDGGEAEATGFITRFFYPMFRGHEEMPRIPSSIISRAHPGKGRCYSKVDAQGVLSCVLSIKDEPGIGREGYVAQSKKTNSDSRVAEYNADLKYVIEQLPEEFHKYLIAWPLDSDYKEFEGVVDLDIDWTECVENNQVRLHTLLAKMGLDKPVYADEQLDDGLWVATLQLDSLGLLPVQSSPASKKSKARQDVSSRAMLQLQKRILFPFLSSVRVRDFLDHLVDSEGLESLYEDGAINDSSLKSKLYEFCQRFNLAVPEVSLRRRAGLLSEPIQYYARAQGSWLLEKIQGKTLTSSSQAEKEIYRDIVKRLFAYLYCAENKKINPKNLMLIRYLSSGLADETKSKKQLLLEAAVKMNQDVPKIKTFYAEADIAEQQFYSVINFQDIVVTGDPQTSVRAAEDQACQKLLVEWLKKIKISLLD